MANSADSAMPDHGVSINKHCTCIQKQCPILGNCVLCIENHRSGGNHMPECMQDMIRGQVAALSRMVEFDPVERRPPSSHFEKLDKPAFVAGTLSKHR